MMQPLSPHVRQIAAVGLLLAVLALIASVTILPVAARIGELSDQIESERSLLGRFVAMAALQDKLSEMQNAGRAASESGAYLKGESDAIRAAGLQTFMSDLAGANGVRLNSTRPLPPRERDELRLVGTRVQFTADIEQLREMLYSIESTQPFLFVEAVQVRPVSALAQRDPEFGGLLDVRLDVFGALPRKRG
jgi:general secretion pathway protein M